MRKMTKIEASEFVCQIQDMYAEKYHEKMVDSLNAELHFLEVSHLVLKSFFLKVPTLYSNLPSVKNVLILLKERIVAGKKYEIKKEVLQIESHENESFSQFQQKALKLSEDKFRNWFSKLQFVKFENETLFLEAETRFIKEWVTERMFRELEAIKKDSSIENIVINGKERG